MTIVYVSELTSYLDAELTARLTGHCGPKTIIGAYRIKAEPAYGRQRPWRRIQQACCRPW